VLFELKRVRVYKDNGLRRLGGKTEKCGGEKDDICARKIKWRKKRRKCKNRGR
jgi:hypothetical protein